MTGGPQCSRSLSEIISKSSLYAVSVEGTSLSIITLPAMLAREF